MDRYLSGASIVVVCFGSTILFKRQLRGLMTTFTFQLIATFTISAVFAIYDYELTLQGACLLINQ